MFAVEQEGAGSSVATASQPALWDCLTQDYPGILDYVFRNCESQIPLIRISCLELFRQAVTSYEKLQVLFISEETARLFLVLIRIGDASGGQFAALFDRCSQFLRACLSSARPKQNMITLNLLWAAFGEQCEDWSATDFCYQLVAQLRRILAEGHDRLVQDRVLDVLAALLDNRILNERYDISRNVWSELWIPLSLTASTQAICAAFSTGLLYMQRAKTDTPGITKRDQCDTIADQAKQFLRLSLDLSNSDALLEQRGNYDADVSIARVLKQNRVTETRIIYECIRIIGHQLTVTHDVDLLQLLLVLLDNKRVQSNQKLMNITLGMLAAGIKVTASTNSSNLELLPKLLTGYAIRPAGIMKVLDSIAQMYTPESGHTAHLTEGFEAALARALGRCVLDGDWEVRDSVLEFVLKLIAGGSEKGRSLVERQRLVDLAVDRLRDKEAYALESRMPAAISLCKQFAPGKLAELLEDTEAFVRRVAVDFTVQLLDMLASAQPDSQAFASLLNRSLSYELLHCLYCDQDFEVRVRCARLLCALTDLRLQGVPSQQQQQLDIGSGAQLQFADVLTASGAEVLLVDMLQDSSRFVRRVAYDYLAGVRARLSLQQGSQGVHCNFTAITAQSINAASSHKRPKCPGNTVDAADGSTGEGDLTASASNTDYGRALYEKLCAVDFERIGRGLEPEHLYQEAIETDVADVLMAEPKEANSGNNILDCYN
ncbi:hypothetical protein EV182_001639 [Spiromyces aspiralis]|uniref:Uncharacterized protein n=1 Tax=Spiromyces aspiralis TaxID=68401 RepID=A0ACC1HSV0_9FUNG|nr:hypothetical protein EV182_001639 [Spiromyces aspiralis]